MTDSPWTISSVLNWTRGYFEKLGLPSSRLDAELIMGHALSMNRMQLYLEHHKPLTIAERERIRAGVKRRARGEPVAYIIGRKGFYDIEVVVDQRVLVPRPETEGVVERALEVCAEHASLTFVDVGCGSGCIGLTLANSVPEAHGIGIDISPGALEIAGHNASLLGLTNIEFREGDLLSGLDQPVDLIVSNPPYIPSETIETLMKDVRDFEPRLALDGGPDGLTVYRKLVPQAVKNLRPGGHLIMEIGHDQKNGVEHILADTNAFETTEFSKDLSGHDRVVYAQKKLSN